MRKSMLLSVPVLWAAAGAAEAWEFRTRWVERVGAVSVPIPLVDGVQTIVVSPGSSHQYRIQFGVFDDDDGPAPANGFYGWFVGVLDFTGGTTVVSSNVRVIPFNGYGGENNGFVRDNDVRGISAELNFQNGYWDWDPQTQMPGPPPQPTIYGLNMFADVFRVNSVAGTSDYSVTASGYESVVDQWYLAGGPPDEAHPHVLVNLIPGPMAPPTSFTAQPLSILVPAPGAAGVLIVVVGVAVFRRRARVAEPCSHRAGRCRSGPPWSERGRRVRKAALLGVVVLGAMPSVVGAYEIRARWVERVGTVNVVIPSIDGVQTIVVEPGSTHNYRIQFGVFDDDAGPAPEGGFLGWYQCRLDFTGGTTVPGAYSRLSPFTFSTNGNGVLMDNDIHGFYCALGFQNAFWDFDFETMMPGPPPEPMIYGLNTFVDVYRVRSVAGTSDYSVTAIGNEFVGDRWMIIGGPPDESNPHAAVTLAPQAIQPPTPFTHRLDILVPGPGVVAVLGVGGLAAFRRRTRAAAPCFCPSF